MRRFYSTLIVCFIAIAAMAQGWPQDYKGVMLQGFYWDSYDDTQWQTLEKQANDLATSFDLIWIPQSGNCGGTSMGYDDLWWFENYNSSFGNEKQLRSMIKTFKEKGLGTRKVNYKLRDWVFSRQRYWGEPIPVVHCPKCGNVPVPEEQLPLTLPDVESYQPTGTGESPLAAIEDWVNTTCPCCNGPAKRETNTMPQWAGSSWYFLRYMDPRNKEAFASKEALDYWSPVDWYNGGMEHTTLHLLYSRFWNRFLYDMGAVPVKEPYAKRTSHGMILGENGEKMSKSLNNFFTIRDVLAKYDPETVRYFLLSAQYRRELNFSRENLDMARAGVQRLYTALRGCPALTGEELPAQDEFTEAFRASMDDDFNTPAAIAVLYDLARCLNKSTGDKRAALGARLRELGAVLGILQLNPEAYLTAASPGDEKDGSDIQQLVDERTRARQSRDFKRADAIRQELQERGIELEDGPSGTVWRRR